MKVFVGISNRHVHLKEETFNILFGDEKLTKKSDLLQPNQFASNQKVTIKTAKNVLENVRIVGPFRLYNQIEISKTDANKLGINPPVRSSGDVLNSEVVTLIGPVGEVTLDGCIIAARHIHINKTLAQELGYVDGEKVSVKISGEKGGIIDNVNVEVSNEAYFELHIDTDDGNAHLLKQGDEVEIL